MGGNINSNVLNQEYEIQTVPSPNTYTITAKNTSGVTVTANSSDTGDGGSGVDGVANKRRFRCLCTRYGWGADA